MEALPRIDSGALFRDLKPQPAFALMQIASRAAEVLNVGKKGRSLVVSTHPLTRGQESPVGTAFLSENYPKSQQTVIVDTPLETLNSMRLLLHSAYRKFDCVVSLFESHHLRDRDLRDHMEILGMLSHGVVIVADYAFAGESEQSVRPFASTSLERVQQENYGNFQAWLRAHAVYTPAGFMKAVMEPGWCAAEGIRLQGKKVAAVLSNSLAPPLVREMVQGGIEDTAA